MTRIAESAKGADVSGIVKTLIATLGAIVIFTSFGTKLGRAEKSIEILCSSVTDNAKRQQVLEVEVSNIKVKAARFEGIMDERTKSIQDNVNVIRSDMKKLLENLELVKE